LYKVKAKQLRIKLFFPTKISDTRFAQISIVVFNNIFNIASVEFRHDHK